MKRLSLTICSIFMMVLSIFAEGKAKYVFYFIGDGMGVNQTNFDNLMFTTFPYCGLATTFSATNGVTDSAAGGTALATGKKTSNGSIGMLKDGKTEIKSIAEAAKENGMSVGIGTSVSVDHATPAAFYAHVPNRKMYHQIGLQLTESNFDFFGGSDFLTPVSENGETNLYDLALKNGYDIVRGKKSFNEKADNASRIILLQSTDDSKKDKTAIPYAIDRKDNNLTLCDITAACLSFLEKKNNSKGFFMMIEGGKIDWACHSNDAATMLKEVKDFDNAIKIAYEFYKKHPEETLIIITADHETGGLCLGTGKYELHTELLEHQKISTASFSKELALMHKSGNFSWANVKERLKEDFGFWSKINISEDEEDMLEDAYDDFCKGAEDDIKTLYQSENIIANTAKKIMQKKAMVGWQSDGHSNGFVPVYAIGNGANLFTGKMDNTDIPKKIAEACNIDF